MVDALRTGKSSDLPLGDVAVMYLGDFAQFPPVAAESMAFGASFKDTEAGTRQEKLLAAFELMKKGKGKAKGDVTAKSQAILIK